MFKKILVPIDVDYPKTAAALYKKAAAIAGLSQAEIRLVSVMPGFSMPIVASYISDEIREEAKKRFKETLETFINKTILTSFKKTQVGIKHIPYRGLY